MIDQFSDIYDWLWDTNFTSLQRGEVEIDPYLANPGADRRRGLTLNFRPYGELKRNILSFLDDLRQCEPEQYYYSDSSLHFTVLTLFTATVDHQKEYDRLPDYRAAAEDAIHGISSFEFCLKGLTVSRSAVILCGFPTPDNINLIREKLRQNLVNANLAQGLDQRYTLKASHTTIMRFASPLKNPGQLCEFLLENKCREFGTITVDELQLVKNDWYMTKGNTTIVDQLQLISRSGIPED